MSQWSKNTYRKISILAGDDGRMLMNHNLDTVEWEAYRNNQFHGPNTGEGFRARECVATKAIA